MGLVRLGRLRRRPSRRRRVDGRGREARGAAPAVAVGLALVAGALALREPLPSAAPSAAPPSVAPSVAPPSVAPGCDPNYSPCVPIASDVDCAGGGGNGPAYVKGPVRIVGRDVYGLDRDHDGVACER